MTSTRNKHESQLVGKQKLRSRIENKNNKNGPASEHRTHQRSRKATGNGKLRRHGNGPMEPKSAVETRLYWKKEINKEIRRVTAVM